MTAIQQSDQLFNLEVGGLYFCLSVADIKRFPDSYFAHLFKDEWNHDASVPVKIDRDGLLFRHIHGYLCYDVLETKGTSGERIKTLLALKREADFFNLSGLVAQCDTQITSSLCELSRRAHSVRDLRQDCSWVAECEDEPIDLLVEAMCCVRSPSIATAYLKSCVDDQSDFGSVADIAEGAFGPFFSENVCTPEAVYTSLQDVYISTSSLTRIRRQLSTWPFGRKSELCVQYRRTMLFKPGGFYKRCVQANKHDDKGCFVYIFHAATSGGVVSATINGQTTTICQRGNCMVLAPCVSYCVSAVTRGLLLVLEFTAQKRCNSIVAPPLEPLPLTWSIVQNDTSQLNFWSNLQRGVDTILQTNRAVVLCLSQLCPSGYVTERSNHIAVDPDTLSGGDALLYNMIASRYDVSVVCVYIGRVDSCQRIEHACILSLPTSNVSNDECGSYGKCRIVCPLYGNGYSFYSIKRSDSAGIATNVWGTLYITNKC